ncbi:MAG TPA: transcription elongation factor GreB [Polyangiaceae bacterium]
MSEPIYMTPEGAKRLQAELARLLTRDRAKVVKDVAEAAAQGDRSENAEYIYGKKKLREIDRRIHWLTGRLECVQLVHPRTDGSTRIFFGAWVELEDENGKRVRYRLVGEDETDSKLGYISWKSPVGRALLKKEEGDVVKVRTPSGLVELSVVSVSYAAPPPAVATES